MTITASEHRLDILTMSRTPQGSVPWTKTDINKVVDLGKTIVHGALEGIPALSPNGLRNMIDLFIPTPDGGNPPISNATYGQVEEVIYTLCNIADRMDGQWHMLQLSLIHVPTGDSRILKLYRLYPESTMRLEIGGTGNRDILLADTFTSKRFALLLQRSVGALKPRT